MKIIKVLIYFLVALCLILGTAYAASRIFLPNWVKDKLAENMPAGVSISIGDISSTPNLGVFYQDITINFKNNLKVFLEDLKIEPRLSFREPLDFFSSEGTIVVGNTTAVFSKIKSRLNYISDGENKNIFLKGNVDSLSSEELAAASNIEFILQGLISSNQSIKIEASTLNLNFPTPSGPIIFDGNDVKLDALVSKDLALKFYSGPFSLNLSMEDNENFERVVFANQSFAQINLIKKKNWILPISIKLNNLSNPNGYLGKELRLSTMGVWRGDSPDCFLSNLLSGQPNCGKMTDVKDFLLDFNHEKGSFNFLGTGLCVTPNAGCLQEIRAEVKTKNTAEIFSSIMASGIINPMITGVLMGSMLSSPDNEDNAFDHRILFEVSGSKIMVNGKSLF